MNNENDSVVHHWVRQIHFLQMRFEMQEAQKLDRMLWSWMHLCNTTVIQPFSKYRIPSKGVSQELILFYLNTRTSFYLNMMNLPEVELSIDIFHRVTHGKWPYDEMLMNQRLNEAECRKRQGRYDDSKEILRDLIQHTSDPRYLAKIKFLLGEIDNSFIPYSFPFSKFDNLSEALGYAEEAGDLSKVCNFYGELGTALQPQYPALSLSMRWQAQIIAEKTKDDVNIIGYNLQRAYSEADILMRYGQELKKPELFMHDIEWILSVDRDKIPTESLKAFYDETRAYLLLDGDAMKRALDYYKHVGFNEKVYRLAKDTAEIAHFAKDFSKMHSMLELCYQTAVKMGDKEKLQYVIERMNRVEES